MSNIDPQDPKFQNPGPYQGHPYPPPGPIPMAPKPPKQKPFGWLAMSLVTGTTLVLGSCTGMLVGNSTASRDAAPAPEVTVTAPGDTKPATPKAEKADKKPEKKAEPKGDAEISDGIYEVGSEIEPGRYKTTVPGGLFVLCSYQRLKDDSGDDDAVITYKLANEGEKVSVTLKDGEFFETDGCGTWERVK